MGKRSKPHCGGLTLAECQVLIKPLYHSFPSIEQGKIWQKPYEGCCQLIIHSLCHSFLPLSSTYLMWGSSHGGEHTMNFNLSPSPGLQVPSTRSSPPGPGCSSVDPFEGHKPFLKTCSSVSSSLHRTQILQGACSNPGFP